MVTLQLNGLHNIYATLLLLCQNSCHTVGDFCKARVLLCVNVLAALHMKINPETIEVPHARIHTYMENTKF